MTAVNLMKYLQGKTSIKLRSFIMASSIGVGIFVVSEIVGAIVGVAMFATLRDEIGIYFPVPYHFHGIVFILAFVLTTICFRKILFQRLERFAVLATLFIGYFVVFPVVWIYIISHGNLSLVVSNLSNLPQVLVNANTFVEDEKILDVPTEYGVYRYRSYFDRKIAEYVYEIWKDDKIVYTESVYSFTRRCLKSESKICLYVTTPFTVVDANLETIEVDYECAVIDDPEQIEDVNNDQFVDLVVHVYLGNEEESYFQIFSLGEDLTVQKLPAPYPVFGNGGC